VHLSLPAAATEIFATADLVLIPAGTPALWAPTGLVGQSFLHEEFLFTYREHEGYPAIPTGQVLVC